MKIIQITNVKFDKALMVRIVGLGDDGNVYLWDEKYSKCWFKLTDIDKVEEL